MHNLIMYHEIQRLTREGFKPAYIARYLVLDRRTVKKYLTMSEEEFLKFKDSQAVHFSTGTAVHFSPGIYNSHVSQAKEINGTC